MKPSHEMLCSNLRNFSMFFFSTHSQNPRNVCHAPLKQQPKFLHDPKMSPEIDSSIKNLLNKETPSIIVFLRVSSSSGVYLRQIFTQVSAQTVFVIAKFIVVFCFSSSRKLAKPNRLQNSPVHISLSLTFFLLRAFNYANRQHQSTIRLQQSNFEAKIKKKVDMNFIFLFLCVSAGNFARVHKAVCET
jgi:hypothetical protein